MLKLISSFFLFLIVAPLLAQKPLPEKERLEFDKFFFAGHKEKMIKNYEDAERDFKQALNINAQSADANFQLSLVLWASKKYDEAIIYAEKAVRYNPSNEWYAKFLINCYKESNRMADAIGLCDKTYKATGLTSFLKLRAEYQIKSGDYAAAIKTYNALEKAKGKQLEFTRQKEQLYLAIKKTSKAIGELESYLKDYPDNIEITGRLADLYLNTGKESQAIKMYEYILRVEPKNGYAAFSLADYYKFKSNEEQYFNYAKIGMASSIEPRAKLKMLSILIPSMDFGSNHLEKCDTLVNIFLEANASSPEPYLFKGDLSLQKSNFETARNWYLKATVINPAELVAWEQALVCDQQLLRFDWMQQDCAKMIEVFPQYPNAYIYHGVASKALGRVKESLPMARSGITFANDEESMVAMLLNLGDIAFHANEFELCDSSFEAALAISPDNALALNNYAYFLSLRGKDLEKAENLSKRSLVFDPKNAASLDTYGWILYMKGDYANARIQIEKSLESNSESAEVVEHYGDVLFKLGDKQNALLQWNKAQKLGGNSDALKKKIQSNTIE
jgi:tetratricopeptide (TPR) repeat protein